MIKIECKLLAFDTSTKSTGYSLYVSGKLREYKLIDFTNTKNTEERIKEMLTYIFKTIEAISPEIIVTEMTVVTRNAQVQRNLTMILGAIYGKCLDKNILYYSFRPTEWRKLVCDKDEKPPRKREELKKWSVNKVKKTFEITDINDDISDAILIGQAYINQFV